MTKKRIYLACPYSSWLLKENERANKASMKAAKLVQQGHLVFSPITHGHQIYLYSEIGTCAKTWEQFNNSILEKWATDIYVLTIDGWKESKGVQEDILKAKDLGLNITYVGEGEE